MCFLSKIKQLDSKRKQEIVKKDEIIWDSEWINKFEYKDFVAPFKITSDSDYLPSVKKLYCSFVEELKFSGAPKLIVDAIDNFVQEVLNSLDMYYAGNLVDAQLIINRLIDEFEGFPAITGINDSPAFPMVIESEKSEVQLFRARLNDYVVDFSAKEMLHIPFKKREIVKSARFSIPGLPCLYLGNTSYACWIEMGCPADYRFNVSPVVLDNTQKVLNLTVTIRDLERLVFEDLKMENATLSQYAIVFLKLLILSMGTSYRVSASNRDFKSEYILSQMIMLACKHRGLDGITYYSKRVEDDLFAQVAGVNVVLFATYNGEEELSEICKHIQIADSFNFSMFKQLLPCQLYKEYDLRILASPYINNIGKFSRQFPYRETQFFEFDKYLFANWTNRTKVE